MRGTALLWSFQINLKRIFVSRREKAVDLVPAIRERSCGCLFNRSPGWRMAFAYASADTPFFREEGGWRPIRGRGRVVHELHPTEAQTCAALQRQAEKSAVVVSARRLI